MLMSRHEGVSFHVMSIYQYKYVTIKRCRPKKQEHFTKSLTAASDSVSSNDETLPPKPVVLPLLQKLYLKQNNENFHKESQITSTEDCSMNKAKEIEKKRWKLIFSNQLITNLKSF